MANRADVTSKHEINFRSPHRNPNDCEQVRSPCVAIARLNYESKRPPSKSSENRSAAYAVQHSGISASPIKRENTFNAHHVHATYASENTVRTRGCISRRMHPR